MRASGPGGRAERAGREGHRVHGGLAVAVPGEVAGLCQILADHGTLSLATVLARTLMEPVVITEHGRKHTITKFEAAMKQLVNKAASGDRWAMAPFLALVQVVERQGDAHDPATQPLPEVDQAVRARILSRLTRQAQQGGADHGTHAQPQ